MESVKFVLLTSQATAKGQTYKKAILGLETKLINWSHSEKLLITYFNTDSPILESSHPMG